MYIHNNQGLATFDSESRNVLLLGRLSFLHVAVYSTSSPYSHNSQTTHWKLPDDRSSEDSTSKAMSVCVAIEPLCVVRGGMS